MKKFFLAGIAAAAFVSAPALAQSPAGVFNWSGFYIGVNGGGMDFTTQGDNITIPPNLFRTNRKEVGIGGIHGGFQGQWGNFVLGIEGSWQGVLGDQYGSRPGDNAIGSPCSLVTGFICQARINDILSVGPRVGFAMGQWMIYGTGGYARGELETRRINPAGSAILQGSAHNDGWYYGGGLEMLVTGGFAIGVEYRHYDFNHAVQRAQSGIGFEATNLKATSDAVLLRLTIK